MVYVSISDTEISACKYNLRMEFSAAAEYSCLYYVHGVLWSSSCHRHIPEMSYAIICFTMFSICNSF